MLPFDARIDTVTWQIPIPAGLGAELVVDRDRALAVDEELHTGP